MARRQEIFTLGHSTRSLDELVKILRAYGVRRLVDVRTIPRSRHNPQFNKETLGKFLRNRRINYRHMKSLGGLRHARVDSVNQGFRNKSFRGYADYMQTPAFEAGIRKLLDLAAKKPTVIVCAEAVPWRCHRSLIADALTIRNVHVVNIFSETNSRPHALTSFAKVKSKIITYPPNRETRRFAAGLPMNRVPTSKASGTTGARSSSVPRTMTNGSTARKSAQRRF
ncbi:MAG: DUF488 domain-containing protein [Elusimicrobia bacterium]|jgi:uncharacterized protein (DUF488 family)|nr:DUF488 domain-containing protein [Elusimicrobiota bacterium]MBK7208675.1 DUF488 domain-containing protein [Elusimicrobiota bacterium]MBK7545418.1 DUF488 domain-containing protein [Elusimicrobiota bacterium]MBK7575566.1 DUF488 domain-containing protein [Elusimicrobiota bacterium]MBK7688476.1 DUF488 domain-containing protein [Elusimicrobiota bacterium]